MDFEDEDWNDTGGGNFDPFEGLVNNDDNPEHHYQTTDPLVPLSQGPLCDSIPFDAFEYPEPLIQNVIASVNLSTDLNLRLIAISARNAEYNPTKVNAVVVRVRNPKCTGLLFRSGRMMVTGARSETDAHIGGKKIAKLCLKVGHPSLRFRGFKVENMIASADCGFPVRLEGLAHDHSSYCSYEPEMFSGLVYRYHPLESYKAVLLVFVSGKVILTGCRTIDHVNQVFRAIFPVLSQYRK
ncbi:uncharacterized protein LOC129617871 [Condylostylus longicornis]|uniref:uncharacterized protein LOC129617871 n=1 Tax=Condylostylus longicornis TaxID=2530218 RepID=UPI00244DD20F|nr:uncharacterized protein LOC129617871 [Condylostylus longicornis]